MVTIQSPCCGATWHCAAVWGWKSVELWVVCLKHSVHVHHTSASASRVGHYGAIQMLYYYYYYYYYYYFGSCSQAQQCVCVIINWRRKRSVLAPHHGGVTAGIGLIWNEEITWLTGGILCRSFTCFIRAISVSFSLVPIEASAEVSWLSAESFRLREEWEILWWACLSVCLSIGIYKNHVAKLYHVR